MSTATFLRRGSLPAALGSLVSLGAQALMALFLLGLFEPQAVGVFSLIAQTAFGWATLALAQSPVSLLANQHLPPLPAASRALRMSLRRWGWLLPAAALALGWSGQPVAGLASTMAWTAAIALTQMGWLMAQSLTLRIHSPLSIALVRLLPPMLAALLVAVGAVWLERRDSSTLAAAALAGYAAGALWLVPVARAQDTDAASAVAPGAGDPRSERLKFIHTLSDVLVSTALAAHWSLVYGAAQAGCLLILLRVMGFVPALVSSAWAQVVMSRPEAQRPSSWLAALTGAGCVAVAALMVRLALHAGWLAPSWSSLGLYVWPLALWQAAACLIAAASHRPFRHGRARAYTLQCIAMNGVQALLLVLPPWLGWGQQSHLWALAGFLCIALSLQALWSARLPSST
jgi:hypothetical protein